MAAMPSILLLLMVVMVTPGTYLMVSALVSVAEAGSSRGSSSASGGQLGDMGEMIRTMASKSQNVPAILCSS